MQTYINMVISNIIMYVFFHYWSLLFLFFLFCFIFFVIFVLFLFWGLQQIKTFLIFAFLCEIICNVLYIRTLLCDYYVIKHNIILIFNFGLRLFVFQDLIDKIYLSWFWKEFIYYVKETIKKQVKLLKYMLDTVR